MTQNVLIKWPTQHLLLDTNNIDYIIHKGFPLLTQFDNDNCFWSWTPTPWSYTKNIEHQKTKQTKEFPSVIKIVNIHNDMIICKEKNLDLLKTFKWFQILHKIRPSLNIYQWKKKTTFYWIDKSKKHTKLM